MRVKLLNIYAGPRGCASPGQMMDLPASEARELIAAGAAEAAEPAAGGKPAKAAPPAPAETATAEPDAEAAVRKAPRRRKKVTKVSGG